METKRCCRCKIEKSVDCFVVDRHTKDGLYGSCKVCRHKMYLASAEVKRKQQLKYDHLMRFGGKRDAVLKGDNYRCTMCKSTDDLCVHHIDGRGLNLSISERNNEIGNLKTLCTSCHRKWHAINTYERNKSGRFVSRHV